MVRNVMNFTKKIKKYSQIFHKPRHPTIIYNKKKRKKKTHTKAKIYWSLAFGG